MTILTSANGSLPLTLRKGETLVIRNYSGTETVQGSTVAREDVSSTAGAGAIAYGPQTSAASLTLSSSGSLDYQVVSGDLTPAVSALISQPTGQIVTPSGEVVGGGAVSIDQATTYVVTPAPGVNVTYEQAGDGVVSVLPSPENLVLWSENFANAWWTKVGCSVASSTAVEPPSGVGAVTLLTVNAADAYFERPDFFNGLTNAYLCRVWVRGIGSSIGKRVVLGNYNNGERLEKRAILTGDWQLIEYAMFTRGTGTSPLYIDCARSSGDGSGGLAIGEQIYVTGMQVCLGRDQAYATTTGSAVTRQYELNGPRRTMMKGDRISLREQSSGVYVTDLYMAEMTRSPASVTPSRRSRGDTIVLAPSDALNPYAADYILSGSADQTPITAAIRALRDIGGSVKILAGTVGLTSHITHDAPWVTLQGEARGFWKYFGARWPTKSHEGRPGGTKLLALTNAQDIIRVGSDYLLGMTRHNGIGFRNLYLYGRNGGRGIYDAGNTDCSEITACAFHNLQDCIDVAWDVPMISGNSMQSSSGHGIVHRFVYGCISGNIMYDIGGSGVVVTGEAGGGVQIVGNSIGSVGASGIIVRAPMVVVSGNTVQGVNSGHGIEVYKAESGTPTGVAITGNTISTSMVSGLPVGANSAGHGIYVRDGATDCAITGNTLTNANAGATGYAVALGNNNGTDTTTTNCTVVGNVCRGTWNNSAAQKIINRGGATNKISLNAGDSA